MEEKRLDNLKNQINKVTTSLTYALQGINAGKISSHLLDNVRVNYENNLVKLNSLALVNVVNNRSLIIRPFIQNALKAIEKQLIQENFGTMPLNDGKTLTLNFPALTTEDRLNLVKKIKKLNENKKIELRTLRHDALNSLKQEKKLGTLSEDKLHEESKKIESLLDKAIKELDNILAAKEKEILTF